MFPGQCGPRVRLGLGAADGTRAAELQGLFHILSSPLQERGCEFCSPVQLSAQKLKEETQKNSGSKEVIAPGVQSITSVRERTTLPTAAAGFL